MLAPEAPSGSSLEVQRRYKSFLRGEGGGGEEAIDVFLSRQIRNAMMSQVSSKGDARRAGRKTKQDDDYDY